MTHEMSHLVIHQATKNPFGGLPVWLDEGIAVYNENRDNLDEDFRGTFERAVEEDQLMTLRSLSSPFPGDPLEANLAYGQSGAVVKYIVDTYGSEAMAELLAIFAEGALYDEALEQTLGVNTDELDNGFRASLGLPPLPGTETTTETESSTQAEIDVVEEENSEMVNAEEVAEPVPTPVEDQPAAPAQPAEQPASQDSENPRSPVTSLPCLAGLLFLMIMGIGAYRVYLW
jgi:hypothetical protein